MARPNRPTSTFGIIACTALAVVLSGCSGQDDVTPAASPTTSVSASASPTPTNPAKAAKQERIADALRRYEEYRDIDEKHQKAGTNGYDDVALYLGHPDIHSNEEMKWDFIVEHGYKLVGDIKPIASVIDSEYDGDPLADTISGHRVRLRLCIDSTGFDIVDPDGKVLPNERQGRYVREVVMQGQPSELWTINETTSTKKEC
ncbi:hypothetical protein ACQEVI_21900 [Promicromonospora sp. CA-289599]|uniref:hypothetical protein n=1 Tax=Promicromonospora sp. CA-289599 TaxID=3240014 RepID=UPI003D8C5BCC